MSLIEKMLGMHKAPAQPAQPAAPAEPGTPATPPKPGESMNNQGALFGAPDYASDDKSGDPLASFLEMLDNKQEDPSAPPKFTLDEDSLAKAAGAQDFMRMIPEDLMQKIQDGDQVAMLTAMNLMAQNAYKVALQHGGGLTEAFVNSREQFTMDKVLPKHLRGALNNAELSEASASMGPATRKTFNDLANKIAATFPNSSPKEVAGMAREIMDSLAIELAPAAPSATETAQNRARDYAAFLDG